MVGYGTKQYKRTEITTADKGRLIVLLYEGAITFLVRAGDALQKQDYEAKCNFLNRAQDVITELNSSLNMNEGGEVAAGLRKLYNYMSEQLVKAKIKDDPKLIEVVVEMLSSLLAAWRQVVVSPEAASALERAAETQQTGSTNIRI
jgi:flagellar protein FliS